MKPRDLFKLAVRILGLVFLYHGLSSVPILFGGIIGSSSYAMNSTYLVNIILIVGWPLLVAFGLIGFASKFTDFFYPKSED